MTLRKLIPALILGSACMGGCGREGAAGAGEDHESEPSQITLSGVTLHSFRGSELVGRGRAASIKYQRNSTAFIAKDAILEGARGPVLSGADAGVRAAMRAPVITGFASDPVLNASGGVILRSSNGALARTPSASFDTYNRVAEGGQGVVVTGPRYEISSRRFRLDMVEEKYSFWEDVNTTIGGVR